MNPPLHRSVDCTLFFFILCRAAWKHVITLKFVSERIRSIDLHTAVSAVHRARSRGHYDLQAAPTVKEIRTVHLQFSTNSRTVPSHSFFHPRNHITRPFPIGSNPFSLSLSLQSHSHRATK
jgi:hypothetical protein